jgi:dolichol-phosphate mannosyltransferase
VTDSVEVSVVLPVYRCEECLEALHERLQPVLAAMGVTHEVIYVDDGSPDGAWATIGKIAESDGNVRALRLSRNFGQNSAIMAGLTASRGAWTVVMDADLQEAPEEIPRLYEHAQAGNDIVHTRRRTRSQSLTRRVIGRGYFQLMNLLTGASVGTDHGTMSMLSRPVVDAYLSVSDVHREYLAVLQWLGFSNTTIEVDHSERFDGHSSYTFATLVHLARAGMLFQTTRLLRLVTLAGIAVAFAGFGLAIRVIYVWATSGSVPGYTSLAVLILVMGGLVLGALGIVGLYVGATFEQAKARPMFLVAESLEGEND